MPQNFLGCDREQVMLMPPSLRDWVPEDHLAWFVIQTVNELDLSEFYAAYREDGHGRAAYDPSMMVALVVYAYARGVRSSREIERRCFEVIPFRVITANQAPDHATIARFIVRHEHALGELFGQVLGLCAKANVVKSEVVAIDGTRIAANASPEANFDYDRIAREIVAQGRATDEAEDERYGEARGDELPPELRPRLVGVSGCAKRSRSSRPSAPRRRRRRLTAASSRQTESLMRSGSSLVPRAGRDGCGRPSVSWRGSGAGGRLRRSLARGRSGCWTLGGGWRKTS